MLFSDFTKDSWKENKIIDFFNGADYPLAVMQANPNVKAFLKKYFDGREVFHELANFFIRPRSDVQ